MRQIKITSQITNRETKSLNKYFTEINSRNMISIDQERELAKKAAQGDQEAINKLVEANLRFVISVAKNYQSTGELLDELISAGNIGLIEAAKRFDETRGFKFISYAVWWIRQSIMQHLGESHKSIRMPLNKIGLLNKIKNVSLELEQILERTPTIDEISEAILDRYDITVTNDIIANLFMTNRTLSSIDAKMTNEENSGTLHDILESDGLEKMEQGVNVDDTKLRIRTVVNKLNHKERTVISMLYGINGEREMSVNEVGEYLDLSRERVRQIRESALRRMKMNNWARTKLIGKF